VERETLEGISFDRFLREVVDWTGRLRSEIVLTDSFRKEFEAFQEELKWKLDERFGAIRGGSLKRK